MSGEAGHGSPEPGGGFPLARRVEDRPLWSRLRARLGTRYWWLTGLCAVVALGLVIPALRGGGPRVRVGFREGHGLKPGDALRYLGTEVGRVASVVLAKDLKGVEVEIVLEPEAAGLAREGSRFWIERPRVSLARVSGLETAVGAKYLGVLPGPEGAPPSRAFQGLETPPTLAEAAPVEVTIRFQDGLGIAVGDVLRYRGIAVGEVARVQLEAGGARVAVAVQLVEGARNLARAGSQFWIERPQVSLSGVRGLETIVGGRHLAVLPGPQDAAPLFVFDGLDRAPPVPERTEGGLEVTLEGSFRSGLEPGSPVTYRGIQVGHLASVGLSSDAATVEARAYIRAEARRLVRDNTRFWSTSGLEVNLGWTGVRMDVESLATVTAGGVALGTPDPPGAQVATGHRFTLYPRPEPPWLEWRPRIPLGNTLFPQGLAPPRPLRAALRWKEKSYVGLTSERQREGWTLCLEGGRLLGPADLLAPPAGALDGSCFLALAGKEVAVTPGASKPAGKLAVLALPSPAAKLESAWPASRLRRPQAAEDSLLVGDPQGAGVALSAGRVTPGEEAWEVDPAVSLDASWHGAGVVSRQDGALIGILILEKGRPSVVPVAREMLDR